MTTMQATTYITMPEDSKAHAHAHTHTHHPTWEPDYGVIIYGFKKYNSIKLHAQKLNGKIP